MKSLALHYLVIAQSLLRIPTYLLLLMYLLVGFFIAPVTMQIEPSTINLFSAAWKLVICAIVIALWYINGTALNDYADYEIDLINLKGDRDRPLVIGTAKRRELIFIASIAAFAAVGLAYMLSWHHALFLVILFSLNITYSIKPFQISRRGGLAPLVLPLGYVALPFFFGYELSTNNWTQLSYVLVAAFYLQFLGRILLKDYRDVKGDKKHGKITFLLKYGNMVVCIASATAIITSTLLILSFATEYLGLFRYAILCLVFFGLSILYQLSHTDTWAKQKPMLAAFGRSMTGVTVAVIAGFAAIVWELSRLEIAFIAILLTAVYLWSAKEAFSYNTYLISKPKKG